MNKTIVRENEELFNEMRIKFNEKRIKLRLSFRELGEIIDADLSTINRFSNGANLDTTTAFKIGEWLGMLPSEIFGQPVAIESNVNILQAIKGLIFDDESIAYDKKGPLWDWFLSSYNLLKK